VRPPFSILEKTKKAQFIDSKNKLATKLFMFSFSIKRGLIQRFSGVYEVSVALKRIHLYSALS